MYIPQVSLIPEQVDSWTLMQTDLPVPSNFAHVINYYGDKQWIGLWVDFPKRLTVSDGQITRTALQLGWHSYIKHPQIKERISWLNTRGYQILMPKDARRNEDINPSYGFLYHPDNQFFYLCPLVDIYPFLKYQVGLELLQINDSEDERRWIKEFTNLAEQQDKWLKNYKLYYVATVKNMQQWLDSYFLDLVFSDSDSQLTSAF